MKPADRSVGVGDVAVNSLPPPWYQAWLRTEFSDLALVITLTWILVFVAEQTWPILPGQGLQPDITTNAAMGALDRTSVARGDWWRFFTNPLLHGGPNHLQWDIFALLGVGPMFQAQVGRAWFGATFALVALISGMVSILINPVFPGTIGPMGVVMGILAANFICGFHFKDGRTRSRVWQASGISLIAALFQTFRPQGFPVDISGHIGGMIAGAVLGVVLLANWPADRPKPKFEAVARITSLGFLVAAMIAFAVVAFRYPSYIERMAQSIPRAELRKHPREALERSDAYVRHYPNDPWAHHLRGRYFLVQKDYVSAEGEFRTALRLAKHWPFGPVYVEQEQEMLAFALWYQGRVREAKDAAAPVCRSANQDRYFRRLLYELRFGRICDN